MLQFGLRSQARCASCRKMIVAAAAATISCAAPQHVAAQGQIAHQPHDVIRGLTLSPDFSTDGCVFAALAAPNNAAPIRSTDGGWTWERLVVGMNNRHTLVSFAVSPDFATDGFVLLASDGDGIYRSLDRGTSWSKANAGLTDTHIRFVACDNDDNASSFCFAAPTSGGLMRSTDRGDSWTQVIAPIVGVTSLAFSPDFARDGTILAGDSRGRLGVSIDRGANWRPLAVASHQPISSLQIVREGAALVIYAGTYGDGILKSVDRGQTFVPVNQGLDVLTVENVKASPAYESDGTLFCCCGSKAVYRSTDRGASWVLHQAGLRRSEQSDNDFRDLAISDGYAADHTVFVAGFFGVARSSNSGGYWTELESRPPWIISGFDIAGSQSGSEFIAMSRYGGGQYVSEDGGDTWQVHNLGLTNPYQYSVSLSPQFETDRTLLGIQASGVVRSRDRGTSWTLLEMGPEVFPTVLAISPAFDSDHTLLAGSRTDGVFRSTDGGQSWSNVLSNTPFVTSIVTSPEFATDRTAYAALVDQGLVRSLDGGDTWQFINNGIDALERVMLLLSPDFSSDRTIFAATREGPYVSFTGGDAWEPLTSDNDLVGANVQTMAISPGFTSDGTMMASVRGIGLFRSTDAGQDWDPIAPELLAQGHEISSIRFSPDFVHNGVVFAASDVALWRSEDGGDTWSSFDLGAVRYEDTNQSIAFRGGWHSHHDARVSAGQIHFSLRGDDLAQFVFVGTDVTWLATTGSHMGIADVYLDGEPVGAVDLFNETSQFGVAVFTAGGLKRERHVLQIFNSGTKNEQSAGVAVTVDAFDIVR